MKKEEVDRKRHSRNVEMMKKIQTEMKRTNEIIQDVLVQQKDMAETEKSFMTLTFVFKDSERYAQLMQRLRKSKEERPTNTSPMRKGKAATEEEEDDEMTTRRTITEEGIEERTGRKRRESRTDGRKMG